MKTIALQTAAQLSAHLSSLRKTRGLTQAALGARLGLNQTRIAKIERDPRRVSVGQLLRLLTALQVQVVLTDAPKSAAPSASSGHADW